MTPAARAAVVVAGATLALGAGTAQSATPPPPSSPCASPRVGLLVPLTGQAARVGKEQRDFARYAALRHNERSTLKVALVERDTRLDPAAAGRHATALAADPAVLAVVGPAESEEVVAAAPVFARGRLPFVSPSARRPSLTNGTLRAFFRVVPHDGFQAPTLVTFLRETLRASRVAVVDDGSGYGLPLADLLERRLAAGGEAVTRVSVDPELTDHTAALASIRANVDAVVLAWQSPAQAQLFAEQLRAVNRRAAIVGTDSLDTADFTVEGSYVTAPLPDVRAFAQNAKLLERFRKRYGAFTTQLGPPAYAAAQAAILAVRNACRDGRASRAEVTRWLRRTFVPSSILGSTIAFTDRGDVRGARFSVFRIQNGAKRLVQGGSTNDRPGAS